MPSKQDSNLTGLAAAEEASLGVLPASPQWLQLEPNSYSDFGNEMSKVARKTINPARKIQKGGLTDVDASGGFDHDLVPYGLLRLFRGFFFTDGDETPTTDPLDIASRSTALDVTALSSEFEFDGFTGLPATGQLVLTDGFTNAANNGLFSVASSIGSLVTVNETVVDEAVPPATARMRTVGCEAPSADISSTLSGTSLYLSSASGIFGTTFCPVRVGDTIFIGGDAVSEQLTTLGTGYARVASVISASLILIKDFTGTPATDSGSGKTVRIFFPARAFRDEPDPADIVRRTYQLERTLGEDDNGPQAEYLVGAVPSELQLSLPEAEKITVSMSYVGLDRETIDGTGTIKSSAAGATLHAPESEEFFNTSSDVFVARLVKDTTQASLVGYLESMDLTLNNGINANKAVGVLGAFDFSTGDFEASGSMNAYFDSVAAMQAIRDNDDVAVQLIAARDNVGFALALPLVTLSGGQAEVSSDEPIMLPLEMNAAVKDGVTMCYCYFAYLPDAAMA